MVKKLIFGAIICFFFAAMAVPVFSQDYTQEFQKTSKNIGVYRNLGDVGFIDLDAFYAFNLNRYLDKTLYNSGVYPSVVKGEIWRVDPVMDVPKSIMDEMSGTMTKNNFDTCFVWEFVFPYERNKTKGYLIVIAYAQETWQNLDCAQAFFVKSAR